MTGSGLLRLGSRRGRTALVASVVASSMAMLDATVANVALPHIGEELHADVAGLQWVVISYLLTLASLILLGGSLGDRFGRRRVFVIGVVWFAVSSAACGLAPGLGWLIAFRALQGAGAALATPTSLALLQASFVRADRARAVGLWSGLGGVTTAVGPFLGGALVDGPGWRWAFLINLPLAGVALVAARSFPPGVVDRSGHRPFDVAGAVLAITGLAGVTAALTAGGGRGWTSPSVLVPGVVGAAGLVAFVVRQRTFTDPLVPPALFRSRTFTVLNVATFGLYAALTTLFFLVVLQLQVSAGWSALAAGTALLPATLLTLVGSARSAQLAARIGPRPQLVAGPLLVAAALLWLSRVDADPQYAVDVLPGALLFGVGLVAFVAPLTASVMASVAEDRVSTASGVNNAVARTAGLLGVALIPSVSGLTDAVGPEATTAAYRLSMWIIAGVAASASLICALFLPRRTTCEQSPRQYHCPVDAAPLQADPAEVPVVAGRR